MILGARFLFITALADKTHYIIQLEKKFSAAACVARGGGLFKKKSDRFLFHSFRAIFLPIAAKLYAKRLPKWKGKGQRAAVLTILFFFLFFLSKDLGGENSPIRSREAELVAAPRGSVRAE